MSLGARAGFRVLNKVLGWKYISVVHDGRINAYRVRRSLLGVEYVIIGRDRYRVNDRDKYLYPWLEKKPWRVYEYIT